MSKLDVFQSDVFALTRAIPHGRVTSYGAIARSIGAAGASRRVGWVLNTSFNAVPPVPAHRVVNRQGMLTGRMHFPEDHPMEVQLKAEGVEVRDHAVVNFAEKFWDPQVEWLD
jgi:methylated-DNA-protein-cysteine methyltransferase-like protein